MFFVILSSPTERAVLATATLLPVDRIERRFHAFLHSRVSLCSVRCRVRRVAAQNRTKPHTDENYSRATQHPKPPAQTAPVVATHSARGHVFVCVLSILVGDDIGVTMCTRGKGGSLATKTQETMRYKLLLLLLWLMKNASASR